MCFWSFGPRKIKLRASNSQLFRVKSAISRVYPIWRDTHFAEGCWTERFVRVFDVRGTHQIKDEWTFSVEFCLRCLRYFLRKTLHIYLGWLHCMYPYIYHISYMLVFPEHMCGIYVNIFTHILSYPGVDRILPFQTIITQMGITLEFHIPWLIILTDKIL